MFVIIEQFLFGEFKTLKHSAISTKNCTLLEMKSKRERNVFRFNTEFFYKIYFFDKLACQLH